MTDHQLRGAGPLVAPQRNAGWTEGAIHAALAHYAAEANCKDSACPLNWNAPAASHEPSATCPKCAGTEHRTVFHDSSISRGWRSRSCGFNDHSTSPGEHLHRYCQTCHFDWCDPLRQPVDAEDPR